jgi:cytochrome c oxidase subunit 3
MPTTLPAPPARHPVVPNSVLGMLLFVVPETLFFVGMISAFTISKAGAPAGSWPVPGQPLLPAASTAVNTAALVLSGLVLLGAQVLYARKSPHAKWLVAASFVLGLGFVGLQGKEWADLLSQGLTLTSSRLGSFFYFIVGTHALHAVAALFALGLLAVQFLRDRVDTGLFYAAQTFWYFVVLMWPVIYVRVYF